MNWKSAADHTPLPNTWVVVWCYKQPFPKVCFYVEGANDCVYLTDAGSFISPAKIEYWQSLDLPHPTKAF